MQTARRVTCSLAFFALAATSSFAQPQGATTSNSIRVTMSLNEDGSRTVYETDTASRTATATTTNQAGKMTGRIRYTLDAAGRFEKGEVYGSDDKLRGRTLYKYDPAGRLKEEAQLTVDGKVRHTLVYSYDAAGKPAGYSVLDASGRLLGQTTQKGAGSAQPRPAKSR